MDRLRLDRSHVPISAERPPLPEWPTRRADLSCVLLLLLAWISAAILVNPIGEFALNDDWSFASPVRTLVENGELRLTGWTGMNLIAQIAWGALFCVPFGFSFTALRVSTLVLGAIGALATYGLLREAQAQPKLALFGSLVLAFSPIYFGLSFTFMTDVPFSAFAALSSWLLLRGLRRDEWTQIAVGLFFSSVAILIRQVGLAIPVAFSAAYLAMHCLQARRIVAATLIGSGGLALQFAYQGWLRGSNHLPSHFGQTITTLLIQLQRPLIDILSDVIVITAYAFVYAGLFLFAFLIIASPIFEKGRHKLALLAVLAIAGVVTAILSTWGKLMPMHGNILTQAGIGWDPIKGPVPFWTGVTFLGLFGAILLIATLQRGFTCILSVNKKNSSLLTFPLALITVSFAPLPFLGFGKAGFYDRYLLVFLPLLMLIAVAAQDSTKDLRLRSIRGTIGATTLLATAVFSVAATHDYLASNRTLWLALNHLMHDHGVKPQQIDGGFEFGGWYLYADNYVVQPGKSWYWVVDDEYLVSHFRRDGYSVIETYAVDRWLSWGSADVLVQRRSASAL
jgi:4-amino-4-deoxy-L-arabinose transferase-like glycosyltransferase